MPQQDECRGEMEHGEEVVGVPLPTNDAPAIVVEPGEEPFDLPPTFPARSARPILPRDFASAAMSAISSIPKV